MYHMIDLNLPGFPQEETEDVLQTIPLNRQNSATRIAAKLAGRPPTPHKVLREKADTIDQRLSLVELKIQQGKRDANFRRIAGKVLRDANIKPQHWRAEAKALFEYTRKAVRYTLDPDGVELMQSPERSLDHGIGDCDDQVIFLASLLQSVGYPVILRVIGLKGSDQFQHIYLLCGLPPGNPSEFWPLDPSRPEPAGWELREDRRGLIQDYEVSA